MSNQLGFIEVIVLVMLIPCAFYFGKNIHYFRAHAAITPVREIMTNEEGKQAFFAMNVGKLINYINAQGYSVTLGEAWRPEAMAEIYAKEGKGIIHSQHTKRLAIDLNIFDQKGRFLKTNMQLKQFGDFWESICSENRWGGYFVSKYGGKIDDADHYEMKG